MRHVAEFDYVIINEELPAALEDLVAVVRKKFRDDQLQWFAVAENRYDNFMQAARSASAKAAKK